MESCALSPPLAFGVKTSVKLRISSEARAALHPRSSCLAMHGHCAGLVLDDVKELGDDLTARSRVTSTREFSHRLRQRVDDTTT